MENPARGGIFVRLDISGYQLLGPELPGPGPRRLLDRAGGGRQFVLLHHAVAAVREELR